MCIGKIHLEDLTNALTVSTETNQKHNFHLISYHLQLVSEELRFDQEITGISTSNFHLISYHLELVSEELGFDQEITGILREADSAM